MNATIFINQTGTIGQIYNAATQNITGSEFLTLLGLIAVILLFFLMFGIPLEISALFIMPMLIIFAVYSNQILSAFGLALIYIGVLVAKNWFIGNG